MAEGEPPIQATRERWFAPYRGVAFRRTLRWLLAGTAAYALLLLVAVAGNPRDALLPIAGPSLYLTPVFGLPYVLATAHRPGRTRRLVYFMILLPLAHIAANYVAWSHGLVVWDPFDPAHEYARDLKSGAMGGVTGATLALTFLHLLRLGRRRAELMTMGAAIAALTALGALGMAQGLAWSRAADDLHDPARIIIWYETVHLPWQAGFAVALAWLMRPVKLSRATASAPNRPAAPAPAQ